MKSLFLKHSDGRFYGLLDSNEHSIGRVNCNLLLLNDTSVSRRHAIIEVNITKEKKLELFLTDENSRYGTYINEGIVNNKKAIGRLHLQSGDKIRFGVQWNTWQIVENPIIVCTSGLSASQKSDLISILNELEIPVVSDWTENCTHLTTNGITIYNKVLRALASGKPIVNIEYWKRIKSVFCGNVGKLPSSIEFVPPLMDALLSSSLNSSLFAQTLVRSNLFKCFHFYILTEEQMAHLSPLIRAAGGTPINESKINQTDEMKRLIVVQPSIPNYHGCQRIREKIESLKVANMRLIPESEIALAIIFCSTSQFCNPDCVLDASKDVIIQSLKIKKDEEENNDDTPSKFQPSFDSENYSLALHPSSSSKRLFDETIEEDDENKNAKKQATESIFKMNISRSDSDTSGIGSKKIPRSLDLFEGSFSSGKRKFSENFFESSAIIDKSSNKRSKKGGNLFELRSEKKLTEIKQQSSLINFFSKKGSSDSVGGDANNKLFGNDEPKNEKINLVIPPDLPTQQILPPTDDIKKEKNTLSSNDKSEIENIMNKTVILVAALIIKHKPEPIQIFENCVNYKKFQKNNPNCGTRLPHIIGGNDLFVHEECKKILWKKKRPPSISNNSEDELF